MARKTNIRYWAFPRLSFVLLVCFTLQLYNWIVEGQRALKKSNYSWSCFSINCIILGTTSRTSSWFSNYPKQRALTKYYISMKLLFQNRKKHNFCKYFICKLYFIMAICIFKKISQISLFREKVGMGVTKPKKTRSKYRFCLPRFFVDADVSTSVNTFI